MAQPRPEVAEVFRRYAQRYLERHGDSTSQEQRRILRQLSACRTAALGGHKRRCDACGHEEISYNSCRNRHCPKCQASARAQWLDQEAQHLLPVEYFHVVFTLPDKLGPVALQNKQQLYGALFRSVSETLSTIARDPTHLGAHIGFLAVLHTWGQNLHHHPHVHCVVPGGGLCRDGSRWLSCREGFFLPVRVLSRLFRTKFLTYLQRFHARGELALSGKLASLNEATAWADFIDSLRQYEWVVYAKPPFGGPKQVLKYLARYTHRVAISNQRLVSVDDGKVTFWWKNYAREGRRNTMSLEATEFIRRFLLHVLPTGFVRIRHYGFLANRARAEKLPHIRQLLDPTESAKTPESLPGTSADTHQPMDSNDAASCPRCRHGRLITLERIEPDLAMRLGFLDTS